MHRLAFFSLLLALGALAAILARPWQWMVDGLSMAPGLMPGDTVETVPFPLLDALRPPRRFDRFVLRAPDGAIGIKRIVGLPGERLCIADGNLAIDGDVVLTPPQVLAEVALPVAAAEERLPDGAIRLVIDQPPLDDVPFAPEERRVLAPVRDLGLAVVMHSQARVACVRLSVGDRAARFRPQAAGRFMLVAGRLDGRFVAAAWPLVEGWRVSVGGRGGFAGGAPSAWQLARPWDLEGAWDHARPADAPLVLECRVEPSTERSAITVETIVAWRDILHRPGAEGAVAWQLGPHEFFVLGDFPAGSRDSRHWGPVPAGRILHRVVRAHPPQRGSPGW